MNDGIDWQSVRDLPPDRLRAKLFQLLQASSRDVQATSGNDTVTVTSLVPRLASLLEGRPDLADFWAPFSALARAVGLWNYIPEKHADLRERILAESMNQGPELDNVVFHREQARALKTLLGGENLVLSAPTSFGKSLIIDAAIASRQFARIVIIVPTIALLDETRRRLERRFGGEFDTIMHHSDSSTAKKIIFIGTQERLINREDFGDIDLLVVDEFYKLDPNRRDERSPALNAAVYRLLRHAKQFFFLGPNIESVVNQSGGRWKFKFLRTRFATVAVDTYDLHGISNKKEALEREVADPSRWPALIFSSGPDRANALASGLSRLRRPSRRGKEMADWMAHNFGESWQLSKAVSRGIAVHHGRVPRAVASKFVRMFNDRELPILICTSTLIEGVNTAAKSVFVYDTKIEGRPFDFFTFSNIRGRAGRLNEHHIGNVFLFSEPPPSEDVSVSSPVFAEFSSVKTEFAVHLEEDDLQGDARDKVRDLVARLGLSREELKRFSSLGLADLSKIKEEVANELARNSRLVWTSWPDWSNLLACCKVICSVKLPRKMGVRSAAQLAHYLDKLRRSRTMKAFFQWHSDTYKGDFSQVDQVFRFLRACEYNLPEYFAAIELFLQKMGRRPNFAVALGGLPKWFRAEPLKNLEERGIPIQIAERFYRSGDTVGRLNRRLLAVAHRNDDRLSPFERQWVIQAQ